MRFWVSRRSEVPVREQLVTQILLGISSKDLEAGAKLPSTRALARQLGIHPNTVSAAYRELSSRGWVERRQGSGVYVAEMAERPQLSGDLELDQLINEFMRNARNHGFSLAEIRARAKHWIELQPPDHLLVVEDDEELRNILIREIEDQTGFPVRGVALNVCRDERRFVGAQPVALYGRSAELPGLLPTNLSCLWLQARSVRQEIVKSFKPLPAGGSLTVASRWPEFLERARTMLVAVGFDPDALHFLDARAKGWERGLSVEDFLITDAVTHALLAKKSLRGVTFNVLSAEALETLEEFVNGIR